MAKQKGSQTFTIGGKKYHSEDISRLSSHEIHSQQESYRPSEHSQAVVHKLTGAENISIGRTVNTAKAVNTGNPVASQPSVNRPVSNNIQTGQEVKQRAVSSVQAQTEQFTSNNAYRTEDKVSVHHVNKLPETVSAVKTESNLVAEKRTENNVNGYNIPSVHYASSVNTAAERPSVNRPVSDNIQTGQEVKQRAVSSVQAQTAQFTSNNAYRTEDALDVRTVNVVPNVVPSVKTESSPKQAQKPELFAQFTGDMKGEPEAKEVRYGERQEEKRSIPVSLTYMQYAHLAASKEHIRQMTNSSNVTTESVISGGNFERAASYVGSDVISARVNSDTPKNLERPSVLGPSVKTGTSSPNATVNIGASVKGHDSLLAGSFIKTGGGESVRNTLRSAEMPSYGQKLPNVSVKRGFPSPRTEAVGNSAVTKAGQAPVFDGNRIKTGSMEPVKTTGRNAVRLTGVQGMPSVAVKNGISNPATASGANVFSSSDKTVRTGNAGYALKTGGDAGKLVRTNLHPAASVKVDRERPSISVSSPSLAGHGIKTGAGVVKVAGREHQAASFTVHSKNTSASKNFKNVLTEKTAQAKINTPAITGSVAGDKVSGFVSKDIKLVHDVKGVVLKNNLSKAQTENLKARTFTDVKKGVKTGETTFKGASGLKSTLKTAGKYGWMAGTKAVKISGKTLVGLGKFAVLSSPINPSNGQDANVRQMGTVANASYELVLKDVKPGRIVKGGVSGVKKVVKVANGRKLWSNTAQAPKSPVISRASFKAEDVKLLHGLKGGVLKNNLSKVQVENLKNRVFTGTKTGVKTGASSFKKTKGALRKVGKAGVKVGKKALKTTGKGALKLGKYAVKTSPVNPINGEDRNVKQIGTMIEGSIYASRIATRVTRGGVRTVSGTVRLGKKILTRKAGPRLAGYSIKTRAGVKKITKKFINNKSLKKVWDASRKTAQKGIVAVGRGIVAVVSAIARAIIAKFGLPALLCVLGGVLLMAILSTPIMAVGNIFSGSLDIGGSEANVREYVDSKCPIFLEEIKERELATANAMRDQYDIVRFEDSTVTEQLINIAIPMFNSKALMDYDLEPTNAQADRILKEIVDTLIIPIPVESHEVCGQSVADGTGTPKPAHACGQIHAEYDCPNVDAGTHTTYFCSDCDREYYVCNKHKGSLACGKAEHEHTNSCESITCGKAEHPRHTDSCRAIGCGKTEHTHTNACIFRVCGKLIHTHTMQCFSPRMELICGKVEHTRHTDDCYGIDCGKSEHTHSDACERLVCGLFTHTHSDACKSRTCGKSEHEHDEWRSADSPGCYNTINHGDDMPTACSNSTKKLECTGYRYCKGHSVMTYNLSMGGAYTLELKYFVDPIDLLENKANRTDAEQEKLETLKDNYDIYKEMLETLKEQYGDIFGGAYTDYDIPGEALSDVKFANMIREGEKYLGYPYVWGGASPSTSFDCSGFVSWVINNSGNGWSVGRLTANGLMGICSIIPPSEAKPGDLIFFQGTYNISGASHVGIYVGNGMMLHCGDPISYQSTETSYWQAHFYCYGRLP